jgi:hypothetical protein
MKEEIAKHPGELAGGVSDEKNIPELVFFAKCGGSRLSAGKQHPD